MADQLPVEWSSTSNASAGSSESMVELNIKTLDSHTYTFNVNKNMQVSALKDQIASQVGVPVEQQRLIFRGKVLKDNHILSEYHVENGDTLHLVLRQSQPQSSSGTSSEATANNVNRGQEPQPNAGGSRNRIGQISHSVVLGTFNVGDQGEGLVPDLSRVIGAVLNTVGIGNMTGGQIPGVQVSAPVPAPESQSQTGSQQPGQTVTGQSLPQVVQIPIGAAIAVPSINSPIPDSLHTLTEFMNRMEIVFSQNGYPPNQSPNAAVDPAAVQLPTNSRGLSTPDALSAVLRHAERLFGGHVITALSQIAGRLEQEAGSSDPAVRGQVQIESVLIGQAMQHLGALLLELGRTTLTLRMGQSPAESSVNAGPAVYISPMGPNPIMVQPFPLQTSSLFGGSTTVPPNPGAFGALGIGNAPRHVNIHIHTVGARTANGAGAQGERSSGTDSGQSRGLPVRNVTPTAVPPVPAVISVSGQSEHSNGQQNTAVPGGDTAAVSSQLGVSSARGTAVTEPSSSRDIYGGKDTTSQGYSSEMPGKEDAIVTNSNEESSEGFTGGLDDLFGKSEASVSAGGGRRSSQELGDTDESSSVPLGLGLGGLQSKRRTKLSRPHGNNGDGSTSNNQNELPKRDGQEVLLSLAARENDIAVSSGTLSDVDGQSEIADAMSQVLQNPALNGLLSGVSQQTGAGSPDLLRNMLQQLTQSPAVMNTVGQIAQQIDTQDLGSMFSGQGGGMDLSRMFQQMMPIVSQALGGISTIPQQIPRTVQRPSENVTLRGETPTFENSQIDLHEVTQRIESNSPPVEVLRSLVQSTEYLQHNGRTDQSLVEELCSAEGLANEFMQMLRSDVSQRFQDKQGE